jgi:hypothetical protein
MHLIKILLFFFIITLASSCKTCNCPAYSYKNDFSKGEIKATEFNSEVNTNFSMARRVMVKTI